MAAMDTPEITMALGTVRRASSISPPMSDAASNPANPKAMVDHRSALLKSRCGTIVADEIGVAEPNWVKATAPRAMRMPAGIQVAIPPRLESHLPTPVPIVFSKQARAKPQTATRMKYEGLLPSACARGPNA